MRRGWCRYVLSSFLLITPMASTICFAHSAPQQPAATKPAKAAVAQPVPEVKPQESSADSHVDAADAAPVAASSFTPGVTVNAENASNTSSTSNAGTDSTSDYTKNFSADSPRDYDTTIGPHLFWRFAKDQEGIWTAPAHLRLVDVDWLLPLGAATGVTLATDTEVSKHLSNSPSRLKHANDFSNYGIGSLAAGGGG